ncbi:MAG: alpha/beta hydrolase family protein [Myxococcota bacterium]
MIKRLLTRSAEGIAKRTDRVFVERFIKVNRTSGALRRVPEDEHRGRIDTLERWTSPLSSPEFFEVPDAFFPTPSEVFAELVEVARKGDRRTLEWSWRSRFELFHSELARTYDTRANRTARARFITRSSGASPRPVVICVHGYRGGYFAMEERVWPVDIFLDAGFDVALFVLPHHGPRMEKGSKRPLIPSADVRLTVDAMRQAIFDLRALMQLLERRGVPAVGVAGMSLGGYVTALSATVEPRLAFAIPTIPMASFADFGRDQDTFPGTPSQRRDLYVALEDMTRVVSPLARPLTLPSAHVLVVAGDVDHVTPKAHAEKLSRHFGARMTTFGGGHLLQFGLGSVLKRAAEEIMWPGVRRIDPQASNEQT